MDSNKDTRLGCIVISLGGIVFWGTLILISLFLCSFSFAQSGSVNVNSPLSPDKQKHIYIGAGIGVAVASVTGRKSDLERILISSGVSLGLNFGKEIYDSMTGREVEVLDVVYGTAGAVVGSALTVLADRHIINRNRKLRNTKRKQ